jgi:hypothetical protein
MHIHRNTVRARPAIVGLAALATGLVACAASTPPPNNEWAAAQADLGRAQAGGAPAVPAARLHLQLAQEDLSAGKQLIGQDDRRATTLIALARTEAQLASSLARQAAADDQAKSAEETLARATGK